MPKMDRIFQKRFGVDGDVGNFGVFGSLAAGSPDYSVDPVEIQSLAAFTGEGWADETVGDFQPALEDMNGLFLLAYYQLCYLFEAGVPEWDDETTYWIGSIARNAAGVLYVSIQDTNLNHALTDAAWWDAIGTDTGNYPGQVPENTANYVFTVSGLTTVPTAGAVYTNNGETFTVVTANSNYVWATGTGIPQASGTLTKSSGTGDASITFSNSTGQLPALDASGLLNNMGFKSQSGVVTAASSFTISNLVPGKKYKLVFNMKQNTSNGAYSVRFNGDSGANYAYGGTGPANGVGPTGQTAIDLSNYAGSNNPITATYNIFSSIELMYDPASNHNIFLVAQNFCRLGATQAYQILTGGNYLGAADVTSITITTSAGTMTGAWTLYELL